MKQGAGYAVCYDITVDRERSRVDKILKGYGFRVQKSVFECHLTRAGKSALVEKLMRLDIKSGSIKMYRIYAGAEHVTIGRAAAGPDEEFVYVL